MVARFAALALFATTLAAQMHVTVSPDSGPTHGGTTVTITGNFTSPPYFVNFGSRGASTEQVDDQTLLVVTPAHLPGRSQIRIFEDDVLHTTDATFMFEGEVPVYFERVLIPILLPRVQGAYGSEFETQLRIARKNTAFIQIWGLRPFCPIETCVWSYADDALFSPAYGVFTDFPIGDEPVRVSIDADQPIWAFISVTNNETQMITTITPQP
jgi:hypothetical protein